MKAIAANWILHSGGAVCRLAHFEYSTKYGMATCHEVVIREKSGLEVVNAERGVLQGFRGVSPLQVPMYALEVRRANSRINVDLPMRRLPRQATRELVAFRQSDSRSSRYSRRPIKRTEFGISIFCFSNILRIISLLSQHSNAEYHEISDFIIS